MTLAISIIRDGEIVFAADTKVLTDNHGILWDDKIFAAHGLTWAFAGDVVVEHLIRLTEFPERGALTVPQWWFRCVKPEIDKRYPDATFEVLVSDAKEVWVSMDGLLRRVQCFAAIGKASTFAYGFYYALYMGVLSDYALDRLFKMASDFDESVGAVPKVVQLRTKPQSKSVRRRRAVQSEDK